MTISSTLMKAILAMDSYNRSYNQGIQFSGEAIGTATIILDSSNLGYVLDENGQPVLDGNNQPIRLDQSIGFYAIAYEYNGEVVVSYRGTDEDILPWSNDVLNAYGIAIGDADTDQSRMAIAFYKEVAALADPNNANPYLSTVSVTGHSMGGGLSGCAFA